MITNGYPFEESILIEQNYSSEEDKTCIFDELLAIER